MKEIPLTRGLVALVDDDDFERVSRYKWCAADGRRTFYAAHRETISPGKSRLLSLHRFIMGDPQGLEVDHVNGNGLDCRKSNLRLATASQNRHNSGLRKNNTSGYKGIYWNKRRKTWGAHIRINYVVLHLGVYKTAIEAALAYDQAARKYHGDFAKTNFPEAP